MSEIEKAPESESTTTVPAGVLAAWEVAALPPPPMAGWRLWIALIGPGVVLAGMSIGTGEWLFGPGVSAQYGASLFWLALTSIMMQAFCNLMCMRYAIYCGEPVIVGILRTRPGPWFWMAMFAILDIAAIWPYNASNAAVPLSAAILGRLPHEGDWLLVKSLGFAVFLLAFVPLIFGGTVYRMIETIFTAKLVLVLGYLSIIAVLLVSAPVLWDVTTGFFSFGTVPLLPEKKIVGRHFQTEGLIQSPEVGGSGPAAYGHYRAHGTWETDETLTGQLTVIPTDGPEQKFEFRKLSESELARQSKAVRYAYEQALARTREFAKSEKFLIRFEEKGATVLVEGDIVENHYFQPTSINIGEGGKYRDYSTLDAVPESYRARVENHLRHEGIAYVNLFGYLSEHGRLPLLDWAMIVGFIGIAGAGGLTNTMFSNYARDKGWGMGRHVGAIPSAIGGVSIGLSHTGKVFTLDDESRSRWRGWMRHIRRDQAIWIFASIIGMALPCMMSLEFVRNATVTGDRVAAMSAEGIAARYPTVGPLFWFLTLLCGFLVLAPGQVSAADQISRRWTDMIWTVRSQKAGGSAGKDVRYMYYGILAGYCVCGLIVLSLFSAVNTAKISVVLQNIALGSVTLLSLYVNRVLMPKELRPGWFHQFGAICCGLFFLGVSAALLVIYL